MVSGIVLGLTSGDWRLATGALEKSMATSLSTSWYGEKRVAFALWKEARARIGLLILGFIKPYLDAIIFITLTIRMRK